VGDADEDEVLDGGVFCGGDGLLEGDEVDGATSASRRLLSGGVGVIHFFRVRD
jgi:archaellum biogenesis ATPase FlaH